MTFLDSDRSDGGDDLALAVPVTRATRAVEIDPAAPRPTIRGEADPPTTTNTPPSTPVNTTTLTTTTVTVLSPKEAPDEPAQPDGPAQGARDSIDARPTVSIG